MKKIYLLTAVLMAMLFGLLILFGNSFLDNSPKIDLENWKPVKNQQGDESKLRFAVASMVSAEETWHSYNDMVNIISHKVGLEGDLIMRSSYKDVRQMLEQKKIDIAFVCTGTYVTSLEKGKLELLAVPEFEEGLEYKCLLVTKKNSGINDINALKGKTFAFTDPESNTGCIVPKWFFQNTGFLLSDFKNLVYTGSHDKSITAVANGFIDAAAVDALIYHSLVKRDTTLADKISVLWASQSFGAPPIVVNKELDSKKKNKLRKALLTFGKTEKEKLILKDLQIKQFTPPKLSSYEPVVDLWREFQKIANKNQ